jgi:hypothetical protein
MAYKDSQDRESINTGSTEHTKTGRDSDAADSQTAFDPSKTSPEKEKKSGKLLEVSGANQDISKPQGDERGEKKKSGAGKETSKGGASRGGSAPKKGAL